jgi:hypothetical protein
MQPDGASTGLKIAKVAEEQLYAVRVNVRDRIDIRLNDFLGRPA